MTGWIKLHRQIQDNPLWLKENFTDGQAWIDMLMLANHKEGMIHKRGIRVIVPRGYFGWSEVELGNRWKWSRGKVRRFFQFLVQQNMIEIEQQNFKLTTLIKIVNYPYYQGDDTTDDTTERTSNEHETNMKRYTNNNDKKNKKEKHINIPKINFAENIQLTQEEFDKLVLLKTKPVVLKAIQYLSEYKIEKTYKTNSDYLTIKRWVFEAVGKQGVENGNSKGFIKRNYGADRELSPEVSAEADEINRKWAAKKAAAINQTKNDAE